MNKTLYFLISIICILGMASCSEQDNATDEYPQWQSRNEAYFEEYYDSAANGMNGWQTLKAISKDQTSEGDHTDYILVKVLKAGTGTTSPYSNDSVRIHYRGWLMPSETYSDTTIWKTGYQFDSSWYGDYNLSTMTPYEDRADGFVPGFDTAIQHMKTGDRWLVIIPYQLGYDDVATTSIPAYSTLKFDITLHSFTRAGHSLPTFQ